MAPGSEGRSWRAGAKGAAPGIFLKGRLVVGDVFPRELVPGGAEVLAEITGVDVPVTLSDGRSYLCAQVRVFSPRAPAKARLESFAPQLGLVLAESGEAPTRVELVETRLDARPSIDPADFVDHIDNPLFPQEPGTMFFFEGQTAEGEHRVIETRVTFRTREILGVRCTVVEDREYRDGALAEETSDWYAQDVEGNVWYFGEDSRQFDGEGRVSGSESWEAGRRGAYPGIIMPARPRVGDSYRQENAPGVGDELSEVRSVDSVVDVPYRLLLGCLETFEWSPLDGTMQSKFYAAGIGPVLEVAGDGPAILRLVDVLK